MLHELKKIVDFSEYWLSKSQGGLPAFKDLLPEEIFRSLPNLVVWQVVDDGADFHCRLCGGDLNRNYGWNPTGKNLNDIIRQNPSVAVFADNFRRCMRQQAPITVIDSFTGHLGTAKRTVGIIAPLADPAGRITELICCSLYLANDDHEEADRQLSALFPRIENKG